MLDKYESDWILNELAALRRFMEMRIDKLERKLAPLMDSNSTPVDHERVAENLAKHSEEAMSFFLARHDH